VRYCDQLIDRARERKIRNKKRERERERESEREREREGGRERKSKGKREGEGTGNGFGKRSNWGETERLKERLLDATRLSRWLCHRSRDRLQGVPLVLPLSPLYVKYTVCTRRASVHPRNPSRVAVPRVYIRSVCCVVSVWHVCARFARPVDKCLSAMPTVRKYRRDTSEVSCCLKYVIFGFNVMFWVSTARANDPAQGRILCSRFRI